MMPLYSALLLFSVAIPFALSFDRKLQFYKQWKFLFPAIIVVALFFIAIDIYFTKLGVWGFNSRYHSDIKLFGLPIEEWLFFIAIPYASIFLHDAVILYFKSFRLTPATTNRVSAVLILLLLILLLLNLEKAYTVYILITTIIVLIAGFFDSSQTIGSFYLTFLIILLPFIVVNAILTGSFIDEPVVWYNNSENLGLRFLTIPVEDFGYAFSLILSGLLLRSGLKNTLTKIKDRNGR